MSMSLSRRLLATVAGAFLSLTGCSVIAPPTAPPGKTAEQPKASGASGSKTAKPSKSPSPEIYCEGQKQVKSGFVCPKGAEVAPNPFLPKDSDKWRPTGVSRARFQGFEALKLTAEYRGSGIDMKDHSNLAPELIQTADIATYDRPTATHQVPNDVRFKVLGADTPRLSAGPVAVYYNTEGNTGSRFQPNVPVFAEFLVGTRGGWTHVFVPLS